MKYVAFVLLTLVSFNVSAQGFILKGTVRDTVDKKVLKNASIVLLNLKDSVLYKTTRTQDDGHFDLSDVDKGSYILMIAYPQYADYLEKIELNESIDLKIIPLNTKVHLLKEVIIKNTVSAIRVKGDTTEYKADSFRVTPNADVQELLKKMPGFQVNSKGEITTQGEKVNKVLVDGEEFFSDDPAVVTKNLRADAVDKVQVFDKKSDQAAFTGIDDGQTSKTINLQLKEDKKNGHYGKFEVGSNLDKYSNGKALINAFKGKKKFAGYLTTDNTKFEGLNWEEQRNYSDGGNSVTTIGDDGSMSIFFSSGGDDFDEQIGLPNQQSGGLVLANKWGNTSTNNTGQYQRLQSDAKGTSYTKTILSNSILNNNTTNDQALDKRKYRFNTINEWGTDSTGLFKITFKAANTLKDASADYSGLTTNEFGTKINQTERQTSLSEDDKLIVSNLSYRKKFTKKGRTISVLSDLNFNDKAQDATLISENIFFDAANSPTFIEKVDQIKANQQTTSSIASNMVYTEPLSEKSFLIFKYGLTVAKNDAERVTSNNNGAIIDSLSNHFVFNTVNNSGSLSYRYVAKKVNFIIGSGVGTANYQLNDLELGTNRGINFTNFIPSASLNFNPKQQRKVRFNYNGNTTNPTLQQIQPIIDNSDPLNIAVGNANLQQGFSNKFSFNASDYKVLKSRSISLNANYTATNNAITNSSQVDANGRAIRKFVNVDGIFNYNINIGYGLDVFKGVNLGLRTGKNFNRYINFVNDVKNINDNNGTEYTLNLNYWSDTWFNFYWQISATNNQSTSSIRANITTKFWSYSSYGNFNFNFKKAKTYISIENEINVYQKSAAFPDQRNIYLVSPSIRKVIGKKDQFELKLFAFDIFNQNNYVRRNISSNFISETTNNGIRRYFLLGFVYNFSKNSKPPSFD